MTDLNGEEQMLAERIVSETEYEPVHDGTDDFRDQEEATDRWLVAEEDRYLSSFSE